MKEILNTVIKKIIPEESILYFFSSGINLKLLQLKDFGYLRDVGWMRSIEKVLPIDNNNNPIPWYTYPSIDFLNEKIQANTSIFEYGSGYSTWYYLKKVLSIYGVETDKEWFEKIILDPSHRDKCKFVLCEAIDHESYVKSISGFGMEFDLIVIDGFLRNECVIEAVDFLTETGVILLDDSQLDEYKSSSEYLRSNGFKELKFWGMTPIVTYKKCTSIFYKEMNCFNI